MSLGLYAAVKVPFTVVHEQLSCDIVVVYGEKSEHSVQDLMLLIGGGKGHKLRMLMEC